MRTSAKPRSLVICFALLCVFTMTRGVHAQSKYLRVAYTAFASTFTILWVGKDSGLYQKYGADMDLLYIGSSTKSVQALLGGDIDIVYSAAGLGFRLEDRAETAAEAKTLALEKMYDKSLLQEIQKEAAK